MTFHGCVFVFESKLRILLLRLQRLTDLFGLLWAQIQRHILFAFDLCSNGAPVIPTPQRNGFFDVCWSTPNHQKWPSDVCDLRHPWSIPKHHSTANNTIAYAKPEYCFLASAFCLVLYTVKMRAMFFLTTCTNKKNISDVLHMKIIRTPTKYGCIIGNTMHLDLGKF